MPLELRQSTPPKGMTMTASPPIARPELNLSQPVFANHEILFSAFELGWGFSSYALPTSVVIDRLGAVDLSEDALKLAFHLNHQRIADAVAEAGVSAPGKRTMLSDV
jgi:hypothetical protein